MPGMPPLTAQSGQPPRWHQQHDLSNSFVTQSGCVKYLLVCSKELQKQKIIGIGPVQDSLQHLPFEAERGWIYLVGSILPGAGQRNRGRVGFWRGL